jgi:hypothetical protein
LVSSFSSAISWEGGVCLADRVSIDTACFNVRTGDIEEAPAPDPLTKFEVVEKNGGVYIKGEESAIKNGRGKANVACSAEGSEKVVIVGG